MPITKTILRPLFCLILLSFTGQAAEFKHPGAPYTQADLDTAKQRAGAGKQPWADARNGLFKEADEALKLPVTPVPRQMVVPRRYEDPAGHMKAREKMGADAWAAQALALASWMSDDKEKSDAYAKKAVEILMAWTEADDIGRMGNQREAALVSCTSGNGLIVAADLLYDHPAWPAAQRGKFLDWVKRVYYPATEIRTIEYNNNWNCWGAYAHLLASRLTGDQAGFAASSSLVKKLIEVEIEGDGSMPKELARGEGKHWYTYYALTPLMLGAYVVGTASGENLLDPQNSTGKELAAATDYFFNNLDAAPYRDLLEGYGSLANNPKYLEYNRSKRPITGIHAHSGWNFPTLFIKTDDVPVNQLPKAVAQPSSATVRIGQEAEFDASGSSDADGKVQDILWSYPADSLPFESATPLRSSKDTFVFPRKMEGDFTVTFQLKLDKTVNMAAVLQSGEDSGTGWKDSSYQVNTKDGQIKVRDGSGYRAENELGYKAGDTLKIRMEVHAQAKTYDVFADAGSGEVRIAGDYGIRDDKKDRQNVLKLRYAGEEGAEITGIRVVPRGAAAKGARVRIKFSQAGPQVVKLTVIDDLGGLNTVEIPVMVNP